MKYTNECLTRMPDIELPRQGEFYVNAVHHEWSGRLLVNTASGKAFRVADDEIIDTADIVSRLNDYSCPRGYILHWPRFDSYEVLNIHTDGSGWIYPFNAFKVPGYRSHFLQWHTVCRQKKWISYKTPKNGCSTVMATAIREDQSLSNGDKTEKTWDKYWYDRCMKQMIPYENAMLGEYRDYRKFLVWRDPVERFAVYANYLYTQNLSIALPYIQVGESTGKEVHLEKMIKYALCSLSARNSSPRDEHIDAQSHLHRYLLDFDDLVMIEDLDNYMKSQLDCQPEFSNVSVKKEITQADLTTEQTSLIKHIYHEDYMFYAQLKHKKFKAT